MSTDRRTVVCYAGDNYWFSNPHSRYHLMHALHRRDYRVLWVNNIGMSMPSLRRKRLAKRVLQRLRSWGRWLRRAEPGFWVLSPIALPLFGNRLLERLNNAWMSLQIGLAYRLTGMGRPVVFASIPAFAGVIEKLPRSALIYYYSDKYTAHRSITARAAIVACDRMLLEAADAVFCASEMVYAELAGTRPDVHYLPHAVDFQHFNSALASETPLPVDLATIPQPRIGYYGSLDDANDQEMIRHAAVADPLLHFVLIGPVLGDFSAVAKLPNVHFLGPRPYAELPLYAKHFDCAFMVWPQTDWYRNCNPLKTKEYLSLGLPVVSTPIEELEKSYRDVVYLAATPEEFLAGLRRALADDSPELRRRRIEHVQDESWAARAAEMMAKLEEALAGHRSRGI